MHWARNAWRFPRLGILVLSVALFACEGPCLFGSACGANLCSPDDPLCGDPTPAATSVTLSSAAIVFASLGETQQLTATVLDQAGFAMAGASLAWSSSATSVASVSNSGLVTAAADGTATITAISGSASAIASVTVQQVADSITVSPDVVVLDAPGDTMTVVAVVLDALGTAIDGASVTWTSSVPAVATVSDTGLITAIGQGTSAISAEAGTIVTSLAVTVTNPAAMISVVGRRNRTAPIS